MTMTARAGRRGKDIRSDCWVQITLAENGGRSIALSSKVDVLYGLSLIHI